MSHVSLPVKPPDDLEQAPEGARQTGGAVSRQSGEPGPARDALIGRALGTAAEQLGRGRFDEATRVLGQVLRQRPGCADAVNLLGVVAYGRGDYAAAVGHFERAVALNHRLPAAHANLGLALVNQGQMRDGVAALARALALDEAHGAALCGMAAALLRSGAKRQAEALYRRAVGVSPLLFEPEGGVPDGEEPAEAGSWADRLLEAVCRLPAAAPAARGRHAQ